MSPYRSNSLVPASSHYPNFLVRLWHRFVGKLVYGGEETCGHCKYWTEPEEAHKWISGEWRANKGDCKLLYGDHDTTAKESCCRFSPKKQYMHRVKLTYGGKR